MNNSFFKALVIVSGMTFGFILILLYVFFEVLKLL